MKLLFIGGAPDVVTVPVPFKTMPVVPVIVPPNVDVKFPPTNKVLPFSVSGAAACVKVPLNVKLFDNVTVVLFPDIKKLFQVIPLVARTVVVDCPTLKVEPVVTTVPAVYVSVPVL